MCNIKEFSPRPSGNSGVTNRTGNFYVNFAPGYKVMKGSSFLIYKENPGTQFIQYFFRFCFL